MLPSHDALHRHWKRTCWVLDMWSQADKNSMQLLPLSDYGWKIHDNSLTIDWDSPANVATVDARVVGLLKGCKCKSGCSTKRYGCRNKWKECSIGCDCINCTNTQTKGNEELLDIVVDEYLAEMTAESADIPEETSEYLELKNWTMKKPFVRKNNCPIKIVRSAFLHNILSFLFNKTVNKDLIL